MRSPLQCVGNPAFQLHLSALLFEHGPREQGVECIALVSRRRNKSIVTAELAAAVWPLVEQVRTSTQHCKHCWVPQTPRKNRPCVHVQVAEHYNLSIISPAPARCSHDDCWDFNPFVWCGERGP